MFKIIIIGDPCCGKTSLLLRSTENRKNEQYHVTIGVDCKAKLMQHNDKILKLQIWDTAGQEKFRTITTSYYRGTSCCVLVFDITNIKSFYNLYQWIDQYNGHCDQPVKNIIIAANKIDLEHQRQVSNLEIKKFCDSMKCDYCEVSVLQDKGVDDLF
jgi:small GTP-binding protein